MNTATLTRPSRVWIEDQHTALDMVRSETVAIAVWTREPPLLARDLLQAFTRDIRFTAPLATLPENLTRMLSEAGYAESPARFGLEADIFLLAGHFCRIMELDAAEIRVGRVTDNACWKFHADYVTARLITTYAGPGTQWLETEDDTDCGCGEAHDIRQLSTGDVAILKGRLWDHENAAVHRSPPIEGTGEQRLVVVINPPQRDDD